MKKRLSTLLIIIMALIMAMPAAVYATSPPPAGAVRGTMTVEYRYLEGQTPNIPAEITRFGFRYYLVSQSAPVLESTLPAQRSYFFTVNGVLSKERLAEIEEELGMTAIATVTPKWVPLKIEMDREVPFHNQDTNDVEDLIPPAVIFDSDYVKNFILERDIIPGLSSEDDIDDVFELVTPEITGVEFTSLGPDGDGLPRGYDAIAVYRGFVQFSVLGFNEIEITYRSDEDSELKVYVIIAEYESDELPLPLQEIIDALPPQTIGDNVTPQAGLTPEDQDLVDSQSGNIIDDIGDGLVPLGNFGVVNTWSLISMILAIGGLAIAAIYAIGMLIGRRSEKRDEHNVREGDERAAILQKRGRILRILTIIVGAMTIVMWLYLDNLTLGVTWINAFTPIVAILFGAAIALVVLTKNQNKKAAQKDEDIQETEATVA